MAKFRLGEAVRYVGKRGDWFGQTGVVKSISDGGSYMVKWDREIGRTGTGTGTGIRECNLEPYVDWSRPVELNDGTPLKLLNLWGYHASLATADGRNHESQPNSPKWRLEARLDNGLITSNHKFYVRNVLMPTIDTKKPLILHTAAYGDNPADFITETSEGHYLVSAKGCTFNWAIFDKDGKFVRSSDASGSSLILRNTPHRVERYLTVAKDGSYGNLRDLPGHASPGTAHLRLIFLDGILQSVEIRAVNKEPINVD